jgi:chromate reductase, NAD(P)H dehydrogenase (quinone)
MNDEPISSIRAGGALHVVALVGSTRSSSLNQALFRAAVDAAPADVAVEPFAIERLPFYDADVEGNRSSPEVCALREAVAEADGVMIVTPEYNRSLPGVVKNAIDWASRPRASAAIAGKPVLLLGATPGMGGVRHALEDAADVLSFAGAVPFERRLGVAQAAQRLDPSGAVADLELRQELGALITDYARLLRSRNQRKAAA